jgi:hypothetical protein
LVCFGVVQVQDLQAELADKQAQLQALSLENLALAAKARALEQLVKSAGRVACKNICICFTASDMPCLAPTASAGFRVKGLVPLGLGGKGVAGFTA